MDSMFQGNNYKSRYMKTVTSIMISEYIKYELLSDLTLESFKGSNATKVNIYIDLYQIMRKLYRSDVIIDYPTALAVGVLNMVAHYRSFYRKYFDCDSRVFLVYTNNRMIYNEKYYPNYNKAENDKVEYNANMTNFIVRNMAILREFTKYINDVYFVQAPFEVSAMIIKLAEVYGEGNPNIVHSTSKLALQLPGVMKNTVIFKHKYMSGECKAKVIVSPNNIEEFISIDGKNPTENTLSNARLLNPGMLSLLMALSGFNSRNIHTLISYTTVLKLLYKLILEGQIPNSYIFDLSILKDPIEKLVKNGEEVYKQLQDRFMAVDMLYQSKLYESSSYFQDNSYMVNLTDPDMIKSINDNYFRGNPIDVERI